MVVTAEIRNADRTFGRKYIAVIFTQDDEDAPKSVFDVAISDSAEVLGKWVDETTEALQFKGN